MATELCKIMAKHGSDKSPMTVGKRRSHDYTPHYHEWFDDRRNLGGNLLEIGIASGASLRGWKEYFPHWSIYGLDIRYERCFLEERIETQVCDQTNARDLRAALKHFETRYDIVIDDGSHKPEAAITAYKVIRKFLAPNAVYVVEDLKPKYLKETVEGLKKLAGRANVAVHDLRYPGGKYDNILITIR